MTQDPSDKDATFFVSTDTETNQKSKKDKTYVLLKWRETEDDNRICVVSLETGKTVKITDYTTNADRLT